MLLHKLIGNKYVPCVVKKEVASCEEGRLACKEFEIINETENKSSSEEENPILKSNKRRRVSS